MKPLIYTVTSSVSSHLNGGDVRAKYDGWCLDAIEPGYTLKCKYPNSQPVSVRI